MFPLNRHTTWRKMSNSRCKTENKKKEHKTNLWCDSWFEWQCNTGFERRRITEQVSYQSIDVRSGSQCSDFNAVFFTLQFLGIFTLERFAELFHIALDTSSEELQPKCYIAKELLNLRQYPHNNEKKIKYGNISSK